VVTPIKVRTYLDSEFLNFQIYLKKIIPFFKKYSITGIKSKDFTDFCIIVELMKNKKHLSFEGLEEIRKIKIGTNSGRDKTPVR
jgi:hypothetical protein